MDTVLYLVIGIAWLVTGTFLLGQYGLRLLVNYGITNGKVQILLFRFLPIMSIRCSDIISIKKVSKTHFLKPSWIWQSALTTLSAGNRLLGPAVLIQKKGWFEYVAI